jgi:hypothetical protein
MLYGQDTVMSLDDDTDHDCKQLNNVEEHSIHNKKGYCFSNLYLLGFLTS